MSPDEIGRMQSTLEGAFPNSKLSPTKVFDAWCLSKTLIEYPPQRRADLTRYVIDNCKEFPTLQQIESAARVIMRRDAPKIDRCLICDDTLWIHYEPTDKVHRDGSLSFDGDPFTSRHVKLVAGKPLEYAYQGIPIEYATPRPCPACNH
jgi:hypothetical protein